MSAPPSGSTIKIKRSGTAGAIPTTLSAGELAINTSDRKLYSSDGATVFAVSAEPSLGNTNSYIATKVNTTTFNSALANTNTYIATKVNTTTFNSALANTNTYIATRVSTSTFNSALANTNTYIGTKASSVNPATSGLLAHTGRATISTNLAVSGNTSTNKATVTSRLDASNANTLIGSLSANGSLGSSGYALKSNGTTVYWGATAAATFTASSTDTLTNKTFDTAGTGNVFRINGTGITAVTGNGAVVLASSPTLITPALGTPSALVGTNITGTATAFTASNVTTNANLTGDVTSVGNATTLATVNSNVGAFGSSTAIPSVTVNAKGLVTAISTSVVVAPAGTLSGSALASGVTSSSLTSLGTITALAAGTVSASGLVAAAGRLTVGTNLAVSGNTTIGGNLTVSGSLTYIDSTTISLGDNMIKIANNNVGDSIDMGIYQTYTSSGKKYTGMIRDASDGVYKFFYGLVTEPNQTIDFSTTTQAQIDALIDGGTY